MLRKLIAIGLSAALQAAAVGAPLVHAHPDDHATEHHGVSVVHAHVAGHARLAHSRQSHPAHRSLADADHEQAFYLPLFVAVAPPLVPFVAAIVTSVDLPVPAESVAHRSVRVVHGHDPPTIGSLPSRAPPSKLA
ncbi:MAG: hypothetical protein HY657_04755 [Acidobacteria bacterium]|nr:hypothetical protein [Acidobacteriota bacterium]